MWLHFHALDLGFSANEFWELSPRAIVYMQREMIKTHKAARKKGAKGKERETSVRLDYIPRP